jgi:hypothetical protein
VGAHHVLNHTHSPTHPTLGLGVSVGVGVGHDRMDTHPPTGSILRKGSYRYVIKQLVTENSWLLNFREKKAIFEK